MREGGHDPAMWRGCGDGWDYRALVRASEADEADSKIGRGAGREQPWSAIGTLPSPHVHPDRPFSLGKAGEHAVLKRVFAKS